MVIRKMVLVLIQIPIHVNPSPCPPNPHITCIIVQSNQDSGNQWFGLATQAATAFVGALFAFGFALWLAHRERISQRTAAMIDEFSSREMMISRFATADIDKQVKSGAITLRDVALTTVQEAKVGFVGRNIEGLTEHQHMSNLTGWYRRLAVQLDQRWISRKVLAKTIGGSIQWSLPFLLRLAEEAESVAIDYPSPRPIQSRASWISAVRAVDRELRKAGIDKFTKLRHLTLRWPVTAVASSKPSPKAATPPIHAETLPTPQANQASVDPAQLDFDAAQIDFNVSLESQKSPSTKQEAPKPAGSMPAKPDASNLKSNTPGPNPQQPMTASSEGSGQPNTSPDG